MMAARRPTPGLKRLGSNSRVVHRGSPKPDAAPDPVMPPPHLGIPPEQADQGMGRMGGRRPGDQDEGEDKPEGTDDDVA